MVAIKAQNDIPFRANWKVVTTKNLVVSGIMLQDAELHPSQSKDIWYYRVDIQKESVKEDFLELRFNWESIYWADLGQPNELKGYVTHSYKLVDRKPVPIEQ